MEFWIGVSAGAVGMVILSVAVLKIWDWSDRRDINARERRRRDRWVDAKIFAEEQAAKEDSK